MIKFRKLIQQQKEEGIIVNAIVVWKKQPWTVRYDTFFKRGRVIEWKYKVRIDLWLAVVMFEWDRKVPFEKAEFHGKS